jgi:hypothetical protein
MALFGQEERVLAGSFSPTTDGLLIGTLDIGTSASNDGASGTIAVLDGQQNILSQSTVMFSPSRSVLCNATSVTVPLMRGKTYTLQATTQDTNGKPLTAPSVQFNFYPLNDQVAKFSEVDANVQPGVAFPTPSDMFVYGYITAAPAREDIPGVSVMMAPDTAVCVAQLGSTNGPLPLTSNAVFAALPKGLAVSGGTPSIQLRGSVASSSFQAVSMVPVGS